MYPLLLELIGSQVASFPNFIGDPSPCLLRRGGGALHDVGASVGA